MCVARQNREELLVWLLSSGSSKPVLSVQSLSTKWQSCFCQSNWDFSK